MNKEDIVEHTLTFGIASTIARFGVEKDVVTSYVREFLIDNGMDELCSCARYNKENRGRAYTMCEMCDYGKGLSASLIERVKKVDLLLSLNVNGY